MSRRRFYVPRDCIHGDIALPPPDQIHHLRDVLRLRTGDEVELLDGEGAVYAGVVGASGERLQIESLKNLEPSSEPESSLVLAQALLKSDRFEWILQKATELGVREIVPVVTRYCDIRLEGSKVEARLERWRRIAREAAKQCRRVSVPKIHRPCDLAEFLCGCRTIESAKFLFCEKAARRWDASLTVRGNEVLCLGPEGGWLSEEVDAAIGQGFQAFNLGPRILRAETAALAAITLVQFQIVGPGLRRE